MADVAAEAAELAAFLRGWAQNELAGYCPLYERVALALADDQPMLTRLAGVAAREKIVAVLLFAAVKSLVDAEPALPLARIYASGAGDPWPARVAAGTWRPSPGAVPRDDAGPRSPPASGRR